MKPDARFLGLPKDFWASVRLISQQVGYTVRGSGTILVPTFQALTCVLFDRGVVGADIVDPEGGPNRRGRTLLAYFEHRAEVLNKFVEPRLMDAPEAARVYRKVKRSTRSKFPDVMNKQKGAKKKPAYLTSIVNMLIDAAIGGVACDYDPRELTVFTRDGKPIRTLARRVDGAFPSATNPIALWEIKEYYHTTTFGSRVADGVYETLLDGMELEELRVNEGVECEHLLIVDSHFTWWECGRSYLCRIIDMLHMGYVDEVLFGRETLERLPIVVREWARQYEMRKKTPLSKSPN